MQALNLNNDDAISTEFVDGKLVVEPVKLDVCYSLPGIMIHGSTDRHNATDAILKNARQPDSGIRLSKMPTLLIRNTADDQIPD